ncbi:protein of unknown function [Flavobacterium flevense]|uniref:DUF4262 domain-containing protein n=1 Tax=Flavobacterium flevense TaxID=983 RepID=A0A4Y4AU29_9FLAO|nr:DUF4262 domain-containing protein [Flavobacterium flevense]GEC71715.1 hypothetical protein FFL01_12540 [Flavobacterium flevense]SHL26539.1 protein of unknown function [Flavobacterium flevense]
MAEDFIDSDIEDRRTIEEDIEKFGCHLILIEPDNYLPGFVYTIGLFKKFNHPEIICFGLSNKVSAAILNHACDLIKQGKTLNPNELYKGFLQNFPIQFIEVKKEFYADYVGYSGWYYNNFDFPILQLVWTDKSNHFPWEDKFNADWKFKQPLLDRSTDFKFYEERNLGVFTTKQVLDGEPILYVYHNEDGDWQFFSTLDPNLEDAKLVSLQELNKLDPTINEIYHLQFGFRAWRETKENDWEYEDYTEPEE